VDQPDAIATTESSPVPDFDASLPPGSHPLEVAARRGIGPLSPLGKEIWHGQCAPCVSCGQLVHRETEECDQCGQDLGEEMLDKMRAHAGPWYVLEHVRPFPGVSLERIIRQVRRGLITETSIVRGPATDHQWRFAVETPGLCRYFGKCWKCHEQVAPSDSYCQSCLSLLSFDQPRPASPSAAAGLAVVDPGVATATGRAATVGTARAAEPARSGVFPSTVVNQPAAPGAAVAALPSAALTELGRLSAAVQNVRTTSPDDIWDAPPRIAGIRATWIAAVLLAIVIVVLLWITGVRSGQSPAPRAIAPGLVSPSP